MLSIIVCSVSPKKLEDFKANVEKTIGIKDYEIIAIDNRADKSPIAVVYNKGARLAKYPNLLFIHEDVCFHSYLWFTEIEKKLQEPDCGVIGFAGSKVKTHSFSGWYVDKMWGVSFYAQKQGNDSRIQRRNVLMNRPFEEVVVLDGFALFVRKNVWEEFPFDEKLLTGFHCYDLDFTLSVGSKYKNYVCCKILLEHFSEGSFNQAWVNDTVKMHIMKWHRFLPRVSSDVKLTPGQMRSLEEHAYWRFMKIIKKGNYVNKNVRFRDFLKFRMSVNHFFRIMRYMKYAIK